MATLYDAVTLANIPANPALVGCYVDGLYANEGEARRRFPNAGIVTITVFGRPGARVGDCEPGCMSVGAAAGWARAELAAGRRPTLYCNTSTWPALRAAMGGDAGRVDWWIAHYDNDPTVPAGAVAKQYRTGAYDTSSTNGVWPGGSPAPTPPPPPPAPPAPHGGNMLAYDPVTGGTWAVRPDGSVFAADGAPYLGGLNNHPSWNAGAGKTYGPAVGIAPFGPGGAGGYEILCDNGAGPQPARYRLPRDGSLAKGE